jgi:hypothetical protein
MTGIFSAFEQSSESRPAHRDEVDGDDGLKVFERDVFERYRCDAPPGIVEEQVKAA